MNTTPFKERFRGPEFAEIPWRMSCCVPQQEPTFRAILERFERNRRRKADSVTSAP